MSVEASRLSSLAFSAPSFSSRKADHPETDDFSSMLATEPQNRAAVRKPASEQPPSQVRSVARHQHGANSAEAASDRHDAERIEKDHGDHVDRSNPPAAALGRKARHESKSDCKSDQCIKEAAIDETVEPVIDQIVPQPVKADIPVAVVEAADTTDNEPVQIAITDAAALEALAVATAELAAQSEAAQGTAVAAPQPVAAGAIADNSFVMPSQADGTAAIGSDTKTGLAAEIMATGSAAASEAATKISSLTETDEALGAEADTKLDPAAALDPKSEKVAASEAKPVFHAAIAKPHLESAAPAPQPLIDVLKVASAPPAAPAPIVVPQRANHAAEAVATLRALPIEIGMRALKGLKEFTIRLDPAELGKVEVKLSMDDEGKVQAKLTVDRVDTLYLLQRDARTLERAFDQAGLKTSPDSLDFNLRDGGQGAQRNSEHKAGFAAAGQQDAPSLLENDPFFTRADIAQLRQIASAARGGVDLAI